MTTTRRLSLAYLALTAGVAVLFALNLFWGSVSLTPGAVAAALLGRGEDALAVTPLIAAAAATFRKPLREIFFIWNAPYSFFFRRFQAENRSSER